MRFAEQVRSAVVLLLLLTLLTGLAYPLAVTAVAQALFPEPANGSLLRDAAGRVVGSELIGQAFSRPEYFHPRPSAAGADGYDPLSSGASNLGPTNQRLIETVQARAAAYRAENGLPPDAPVPVDAVTASGSGLDPHISLANAYLQVPRVAAARHRPESEVRDLVTRHLEERQFGVLGEPRVNVVKLNLELDRVAPR